MEKLWRFAKTEISRRTLFRSVVALVAAGFAGKWLADEYAESGGGASGFRPESEPTGPGSFIDVREFKKTMTVEQLNRTAESYFASSNNWESWLAKPFTTADGPDLLMNVSNLLRGLQLESGMTVLDFGAGSCWLSRWLTQMGMKVIALDVSATALKIGQALYERQPVIGKRPAPRFLVSDGRRIDLPDASVDRILCLDVFHHLLNPDVVLREMSRVLKPDGVAGFSEPGPNHSKSPGSQFEMRNFQVLEDDVDIVQIWSWAKEMGFLRLRLGVFSPEPMLFALPEFEDYLKGASGPSEIFQAATRANMQGIRLFFLHKSTLVPAPDSRGRTGMIAKLQVNVASTTVKAGTPVTAQVVVTNGGRALWLPRSAKNGAVTLGCHLLDGSGKMLDLDFLRHALTPGDGRPIASRETVKLDIKLPPLAKGRYILEFDLVSESVGWFAYLGSQAVRIAVEVT